MYIAFHYLVFRTCLRRKELKVEVEIRSFIHTSVSSELHWELIGINSPLISTPLGRGPRDGEVTRDEDDANDGGASETGDEQSPRQLRPYHGP
jgi:hypothetical protein